MLYERYKEGLKNNIAGLQNITKKGKMKREDTVTITMA